MIKIISKSDRADLHTRPGVNLFITYQHIVSHWLDKIISINILKKSILFCVC